MDRLNELLNQCHNTKCDEFCGECDLMYAMAAESFKRSCETCRKYLGGGQCRDNLEKECADGEYEMWEDVNDEPRES